MQIANIARTFAHQFDKNENYKFRLDLQSLYCLWNGRRHYICDHTMCHVYV